MDEITFLRRILLDPTPDVSTTERACPDSASLIDLLEGTTTDKSREALRQHLMVCTLCSDLYARLQEFKTAEPRISDGEWLPVESRLQVWTRSVVQSALPREITAARQQATKESYFELFRGWNLRWAAGIAALLILLTIGIYWKTRQGIKTSAVPIMTRSSQQAARDSNTARSSMASSAQSEKAPQSPSTEQTITQLGPEDKQGALDEKGTAPTTAQPSVARAPISALDSDGAKTPAPPAGITPPDQNAPFSGTVAEAVPADSPRAATGIAGSRKRIAVLDFDYATVMKESQAVFGSNVDVGKAIAGLVTNTLARNGSYSVVDPKTVEKILSEQNFSNSDRADANFASRIGKLLGVDAIVVGTVTQFGNDAKTTNVGGGGGRVGGFGIGAFGIGAFGHTTKAVVQVDVRLINIDTAEIEGVATGKGESSRESASRPSSGNNWHGWAGGGVDFGSSDFQQTKIGEAVTEAVSQLSTEIAADHSKIVAHTVKVEGMVISVDSDQIILDIGGKAGLKIGDQLTVKRSNKQIKDPTTGTVIGKVTADVGVIRVTDVDDTSAMALPVSGSGFKVGDEVTLVAR